MRKLETRFSNFSDGGETPLMKGIITGNAITYGEKSTIAGAFKETFSPGCFGQYSDVMVNIQHQKTKPVARQGAGLVLHDDEKALRAEIDLTGTPLGLEARSMIDKGLLRGLSVEFYPDDEVWEGHSRIVKAAELKAISIVDKPAYAGSTIEEMRSYVPWLEERQGSSFGLLPLVLAQVQVLNQQHDLAIQRYLAQKQDLIERQIASKTYRDNLVRILQNLGGNRWLLV